MNATARQNTIAFVHFDCASLPAREKIVWLVNLIRCLPESAVVI